MKYLFITIIALILLSGTSALAANFDLPEGRAWNLDRIEMLIEDIAIFLIRMSMFVAMGTLVISGLMWLRAGSNPQKVTVAKEWFKVGIIGTLIILGSGVIIRTIDAVVTGEFFF